ncbi:uncharacterized protein [Macrobrachium rosenbergii]|uniref:uncharacterized protein n=1 Tax=Macrobrachium rosenbergii TaxID=79674 RepID=UPI0034D65653
MALFNILQWHCKGLRSRAENPKVLLGETNPGSVQNPLFQKLLASQGDQLFHGGTKNVPPQEKLPDATRSTSQVALPLLKQYISEPWQNNAIKGNNLIRNPSDVAESLGQHFSNISSPNNYSCEFQRIRNTHATPFAVAINSILDEVPSPVRASLFVDDLVIYCTTYDAISACRYLQKAIDSVSKWAKLNGFKFSAIKSVAVRFSSSTRQEVIPNLKLEGSILPYADDVKFLGMTFDSKLAWTKHIDNLKCKIKASFNLLKVVSG